MDPLVVIGGGRRIAGCRLCLRVSMLSGLAMRQPVGVVGGRVLEWRKKRTKEEEDE